jgi:hypothetical protein
MPDEPEETWADIAGYEGSYQVSDLGKVRSIDRVEHSDAWKKRTRCGKELSAIRSKRTGYLHVNLYKDGKMRTHLVHRLVAAAFVGKKPGDTQVNHKNGNKADNRAANLEWCTGSENVKHAFDVLKRKPSGHKRFSDSQIIEIRSSSKTQRESMVGLIKQGKAYREVI